jgi:site-specific recombinase XerC
MQTVKWEHYSLVAHNTLTRTFIEELAQMRRSPSTIDNYSRDLEDFLQATAEIPFATVLEADETFIARYLDGLWSRPAHRNSGHKSSREKITYVTGSNLSLNTIRRRISTIRLFYDWCIRVRQRHDPLNPVQKGMFFPFELWTIFYAWSDDRAGDFEVTSSVVRPGVEIAHHSMPRW